ncbi:MAG: phosphoribosylformylglycinamidine synthase I, partial [Myxococcales bacterium]|nr:phosphoribosylformylglycinamidine synthase I [Myxococcales bacterium]
AYFVRPEELAELEANGQVLLRYCDAEGQASEAANPNGSVANIAGVTNRPGNVLGLMPHPEHAVEPLLGGTDGLAILGSVVDAVSHS